MTTERMNRIWNGVVIGVMVGFFMILVDSTIVSVALRFLNAATRKRGSREPIWDGDFEIISSSVVKPVCVLVCDRVVPPRGGS